MWPSMLTNLANKKKGMRTCNEPIGTKWHKNISPFGYIYIICDAQHCIPCIVLIIFSFNCELSLLALDDDEEEEEENIDSGDDKDDDDGDTANRLRFNTVMSVSAY